jgi:glutaredoxin
MKITVYTVSDCQFSKAEKEYLQSHNLAYEEKNLEQNREWLTEMLAVSNNFAGTPVTKIEKDDGQIIVLKGFTKEEFDQVLGFKEEESVAQASADVTQPPQSTSPQPPTQTQPINQQETSPPPYPSSSSSNQPTAETSPTQSPPVVNQAPNTASSQPADPLSSILSDLEQKANLNQSTTPPPPANIPNIPNFNE